MQSWLRLRHLPEVRADPCGGWLLRFRYCVAVSGAVWLSRERPVSEPVQLLARPITAYDGHEVGDLFFPRRHADCVCMAAERPETLRYLHAGPGWRRA